MATEVTKAVDKKVGASMTEWEIETCDDVEKLQQECLRLRQGLWDCMTITGHDTDGNKTPAPLASDIVKLAKAVITEERKDYDELLESMPFPFTTAPNTRQRAERAADRLNWHGLFTQGTSLIRVADIIAAEFEK